ncbi:MAG: 50S ribosomal protein L23 [Xanthomonadales bacterium]|nr:50S ribosomal protein L23 [Xanthomonadales bacterium]
MNQQRLYNILRAPHISEKSTRASGEGNQYVFRVATDASKPEVKAAVEKLFEVTVESVNIVNMKGKSRTFRFRSGKRPDWKKAYVRVAAGQTIDTDMVGE